MKQPPRIPLAELLTANTHNDRPQCYHNGDIQTRGAWLERVQQWRACLAQQPHHRWALFHTDSGEFAAILFALWSLGKPVCLPASSQPQALEALVSSVDGFAGDFGYRSATVQPVEAPSAATEDNPVSHGELESREPLLWIYTSGSSGEPQAIAKTLSQLDAELQHLYQLWGEQPVAPLVVGTVSHQHIYGLLFRILLPLSAGWCFDADSCEFFEQLQERQWQGRPRLLISSPTHLSRIPPQLPDASAHNLVGIFSSGAPLSRAASLDARRCFGSPVTEVYGSSETGGVAWRQQAFDHEPAWQALPGVALRLAPDNQCLEVSSDHLPAATAWFQTADQVTLTEDGQFRLLGRVDRIAKVEGKRVSLDAMEKQLLHCPDVEQARLLVLEGNRTEIGAVVVLTEVGNERLREQGKHRLNQHLKRQLHQHYELPVLPRRWRYVQQMPFNSQGKLVRQTLLELFMTTATTQPEFPELIDRTQDDDHLQLQLRVPAGLRYFDGHFDKAPILPGVVQLHWAQHYAQQAFEPEGEFQGLQALKFQQIVMPDQELTLELSYNRDKGKIHFAYHSKRGQHASGRLVYGSTAP